MLRWLLRVGLGAGLVGLLAGRLGSMSPLLDLANLAVVPLAALCGVTALALLVLSRGRVAKTGLGALALLSGWMLLPPSSAPTQCAADAPSLRLAWLNAHGTDDPAPIMAWLESEQPDVIGFAELGNGSLTVRAAVEARYPHLQSCLVHQRCSTIIYARDQPVSSQPLGYGNPHNRHGLSAAQVTLAHAGDGAPLNLMAVHLSRPLPLGDQLQELAVVERQIESPADTVIMGDFNMTRRMQGLRGFARRNGLMPAAADRPTWPLAFHDRPSVPILQIDQLLLGRNWRVDSLRTSDDLGSDHRGFVADICRQS